MKPIFYKVLNVMAWTSFILYGSFFILLAYTYLYPHHTLEVKNAPMPIVGTTTLKHGEFVTYHYDYCKYYKDPLNIQKEFVDGIIFKTDPIYTSQLESGCHQKDVSVIIPNSLPPGTYRIRIITQIYINELRTDTKIFETQPFTVVGDI